MRLVSRCDDERGLVVHLASPLDDIHETWPSPARSSKRTTDTIAIDAEHIPGGSIVSTPPPLIPPSAETSRMGRRPAARVGRRAARRLRPRGSVRRFFSACSPAW
jgi:hypothetical protein